LEEALSFQKKALKTDPKSPRYRGGLIRCYLTSANLLGRLGKVEQGEKVCNEALAVAQGLMDDFPKQPESRFHLAWAYLVRGDLLPPAGRMADKDQAYHKARELLQQLVDEFPKVADYHGRLGHVLHQLAVGCSMRGDNAEAVSLLQQAIDQQRAAWQIER